MGILAVVVLFLAYGLFGYPVPRALQSRPLSELVVYLAIDANGILGTALKVAVIVVVPYMLFGQLLSRCGAADFFNDIVLCRHGPVSRRPRQGGDHRIPALRPHIGGVRSVTCKHPGFSSIAD